MSHELSEQLSPADKIEREEIEKAFREVLALASGKRVIFWMLAQCAMDRDAFTGDRGSTDYTLGQQASGRRLIWMLDDLDPRIYPTLLLDIAELKAMDRAAAKALTANEENDDDED